MTAPVDLDAYCARIGYDGPRTPTLDTLRAIHALHPAAIPFEAIDVLLDRGISLAPADIDAKLIARRRGGYCFEQNALLKRVLVAMGFAVEGLLGRVHWMVPPEIQPLPRNHMALRVTLEGEPWLVDVGFGSLVSTAPLRFDTSDPQPTASQSYRVRRIAEGWLLEGDIEGWQPLYTVSDEPHLDVDFEPANWFTATFPQSVFRHSLMVARTTPEARYSLRDNRLTIRHADGRTEQQTLDGDGLLAALGTLFVLPVEPGWRPAMEQLVERAQATAVA